MIYKTNWGELPRICTHNINHILQTPHTSCTQQLHEVQLELQQEFPENLQAILFFSHNEKMYTGHEAYSLPPRFHDPLHHFSNLTCSGFSYKSNKYFRQVLNYTPTIPTLVFVAGEQQRMYLLLEGPHAIECAKKKHRRNSWFRLLQQVHKNILYTQHQETLLLLQSHKEQQQHTLEFGHDLKNRLRHNPTHPQISKDIDSFLHFQKPEKHSYSQPFSFLEIQEEIASFYHTHPKNIQINWPTNTPNFQLIGHKSKLFRAILNVIDNAIDAMKSEGVINCLLQRKNTLLQIEFQNNGPEINPNLAIFELFLSDKGSSGLGLSMSRKWLRAMGGDLILQNTKPVTFAFTLRIVS